MFSIYNVYAVEKLKRNHTIICIIWKCASAKSFLVNQNSFQYSLYSLWTFKMPLWKITFVWQSLKFSVYTYVKFGILLQAMFELVTSEASYYKSLNLLVYHFMENERLKKILHPSEAHILFSNVLDVMAVSER